MKRWETRCICGDSHNETKLCVKCDEEEMVCCDRCEKWSHLECLHLDSDDVEARRKFICPFCEREIQRIKKLAEQAAQAPGPPQRIMARPRAPPEEFAQTRGPPRRAGAPHAADMRVSCSAQAGGVGVG